MKTILYILFALATSHTARSQVYFSIHGELENHPADTVIVHVITNVAEYDLPSNPYLSVFGGVLQTNALGDTVIISFTNCEGALVVDTETVAVTQSVMYYGSYCSTSGVDVPDQTYFLIVPNPVSEVAILEGLCSNGGVREIGIYDSRGRLVRSVTTSGALGARTTLPVGDLSSGLYLVAVSTRKGMLTRTFFK